MELRPFQNQALNCILESYKAGKKSALLIMPAGTGKTLLSLYVFKQMAEDFKIDSMAYIATTSVMQTAFNNMVEQSINLNGKFKRAYTYKEIAWEIERNLINPNEFQVIIFDDVTENDQNEIEKIYNHFQSFKIGFARSELSKNISIFQADDGGIVYKYSLNQAILDGHFLSSQKAIYNHFFYDLSYQINNIEIGTDWSHTLKQNLIEKIDLIKNENTEYLKAQELLLSGKINTAEIIELSHRKEQLEEFNRLLNDDVYFDVKLKETSGAEAVWQNYFEMNPWIFGFGLNYIFNAPLEGKKLEQTVEGYSINGHGKRTDALLRTTGLIQTLCFGEIKTHRKHILKVSKEPYRPESWAISDELAGGISQIHKTIQKSLKNISTVLSLYDDDGFKLRDPIYLFKPKSFLIIGSLKEFKNKNGDVHEDKFSSFELFRRSISDIEIITYDELYERAHAIINKKWNKT